MHHQKMTTLPADLLPGDPDARGHRILDTLVDAFSNLMAASPAAFQADLHSRDVTVLWRTHGSVPHQ